MITNFKKLNTVHSACLNKKQNLETQLLQQMKSYFKQRAQLEEDYSTGLERLSRSALVDENKSLELGLSNRSLFAAWNSYLDDCGKIGKKHKQLLEFYQENVLENIKFLLTQKNEASQRAQEQFHRIHKEIQLAAKDHDKCFENFTEAKESEQEAQAKLAALRDRVHRKSSTILFSSPESQDKEIHQLSNKITELQNQIHQHKTECDLQAQALRIHQDLYRTEDLPKIVDEMECCAIEKLWTYLSSSVEVEKQHYDELLKSHCRLTDKVQDILTPEEHRAAFWISDPSLRKKIKITSVAQLEGSPLFTKLSENFLKIEARKWLSILMRHQKNEELALHSIQKLENLQEEESGSVSKNSANQRLSSIISNRTETTKKLDENREIRRKERTGRLKAQGVLNFIRSSEVDMSDIIEPKMISEKRIQENGSSNNRLTSSSSFFGSLTSIATSSSGSASSEQPSVPNSETHSNTSIDFGTATSIYPYQAVRDDELSFDSNDRLTLVSDPAETNWPMARNVSGQVGRIPINYVLIDTPESSETKSDPLGLCRVILNKAADEDGELTLTVGATIKILSKTPYGINDGWWRGRDTVTGAEGTFPSLMVEELTD